MIPLRFGLTPHTTATLEGQNSSLNFLLDLQIAYIYL